MPHDDAPHSTASPTAFDLPTAALLRRGEDYEVEYKETIDAVKARDLVAFANAPAGGVILAGFRETRASAGPSRFDAVGCRLSDEELRGLQGRARTCIHPVEMRIRPEKVDSRDVLRIDIIASRTRPHCTPQGEYLVRGYGTTLPMLPPGLFDLLLGLRRSEVQSLYQEALAQSDKKRDGYLLDLLRTQKLAAEAAENAERSADSAESAALSISDELSDLSGAVEGLTMQFGETLAQLRDELHFVARAIDPRHRLAVSTEAERWGRGAVAAHLAALRRTSIGKRKAREIIADTLTPLLPALPRSWIVEEVRRQQDPNFQVGQALGAQARYHRRQGFRANAFMNGIKVAAGMKISAAERQAARSYALGAYGDQLAAPATLSAGKKRSTKRRSLSTRSKGE